MRTNFFSYLFFLSVCFFPFSSFSQNNSELIQLADNAFTIGDYSSAAYFYKKALVNIDSGHLDLAQPYEITPYIKSTKPTKDTNLLIKSNPSDTLLKASSDKTISKSNPSDSLLKSSSNKIVTADSSSKADFQKENAQRIYVMDRLALSYHLSHSYENSEIWFLKLFEMQTPNAAYNYGNALLTNAKYAEARKILTDFMVELEPNSDYYKKAKFIIRKSVYAEQALKKPNQEILLEKVDSTINTANGSFAVNYMDGITTIFTSARPIKTNNNSKQSFDCNLYKASLDENGKMYDATSFSFPINSNIHDGAGALSPDGTKLFFTRWNNDAKNPECAIYVSKFLNGQWLTPKKLGDKINMPGQKNMHPNISPDGNTLYFSSDRPGGFGKLDIWYCTIDEVDNTNEVKNLGSNINTPENETTPFFHGSSNTFYFSSDGRLGMGGLDIFKTVPENNEFNGYIENLGSPINSSRDDAYFILNQDQKRGFLSSDRETCAKCGESNCYQIYSFSSTPIIITISGKVYNEETKEPVINSMVTFTDILEAFEPIYAFTDDMGAYKATLNRNVEYFATAQKIGYFKAAVTLNTLNIDKSVDIVQDFNFNIKSIPKGDIEIPGIEYDLGKSTLRPDSKKKLDELVEFLKLNDNLIIEISSHTDLRGSDMANLKLSEARAKSVSDYLIENGIPAVRLTAKGYGETQPIIPKAKTEEEHQKNRRTAFRTLSEDFKPTTKNVFIPAKFRYIQKK